MGQLLQGCFGKVVHEPISLPLVKLIEEMEHLVMTQQQVEAKLLQELQSNLALEPDCGEDVFDQEDLAEDESCAEELNWGEHDESPWVDGFRCQGGGSFEPESPSEWHENLAGHGGSIESHLFDQLRLETLEEGEMLAAKVIVASLDERGYLEIAIEEVAANAEVDVEVAKQALNFVQHLEPVGVAARDLQECLSIQARESFGESSLTNLILSECFAELERQNLPAIAKKLGVALEKIEGAVARIRQLAPYPANTVFCEQTEYVVPDAYVICKAKGDYEVRVNHDAVPAVRVNKNLVSQLADKELKKSLDGDALESFNKWEEDLQTMVSDANWLVKMIADRNRMVQKVVAAIVAWQIDYFDRGPAYMKPMHCQQIADEVEMSESTISRACKNKFILTHHGMLPLRMFITPGVVRDDGEGIARSSVQHYMQKLIEKEDRKKPLSDQRMVDLLCSQGIDISRRGLQKYREQMGVGSSQERRLR